MLTIKIVSEALKPLGIKQLHETYDQVITAKLQGLLKDQDELLQVHFSLINEGKIKIIFLPLFYDKDTNLILSLSEQALALEFKSAFSLTVNNDEICLSTVVKDDTQDSLTNTIRLALSEAREIINYLNECLKAKQENSLH